VLDLPSTISDKLQRYAMSPQGLYILSGESLHVGVLPYVVDGVSVGIFTSPEELFAEESLATLIGAGATIEHPVEFLTTTDNMVGIVLSAEPNYRSSENNPDYAFYNIKLKVAVFNTKAIDYIERGNNELSAGYNADIVAVDGNWHGSPYSFVKKNIRYNHLAIVAKGTARNGLESKLTTDSNQCKDYNFFNITDSKKIYAVLNINDNTYNADIPVNINDTPRKPSPMKNILLSSGKSVEVSDESYADLHFFLEDTKKNIADLMAANSAKVKEVESVTQELNDSNSALEATKKSVVNSKDNFGKYIAIATKAEKFGVKVDYENFDALAVMRKVLQDKYPNTENLPLETVEYLFSITEFQIPVLEEKSTATQTTDTKKPKSVGAMSQIIDASVGNVIQDIAVIEADEMAKLVAKRRSMTAKKRY
jgi:hypothetical protein